MDFFARQDRARASTRRLVVLYALALAGVVISLNVVAAIACGAADKSLASNAGVYAITTVAVLALVALATAFKKLQIGGDGAKVAEMLGGRPLVGAPADLDERKLLNVVEEMSLASGVPTPRVYLLDAEQGINAFAAGTRPEAAVIGVTRGAVARLSRDELQGVVAHEFSHIVNGDMRLNLRMIALNFGLMAIGYIGLQIVRFSPTSGSSSSRNKKDNGAGAILLIGIGMAVIGYVGTLFGKILQAAMSRQREYLADASAVQFTRNPQGIVNALKKIGGFSEGATLQTQNAGEAAHMFFGDATVGFLDSVFATHPSLAARIKAIDPTFDGQMLASTPDDPSGTRLGGSGDDFAGVSGLADAPAALPQAGQRLKVDAAGITAASAAPDARSIASAASVMARLPPELLNASREPYEARALAIALLLDPSDDELRRAQLASVAEADASLVDVLGRLWPLVAEAGPAGRLPLLDLAMPALQHLSPTQLRSFRAIVRACAEADRQLSPFELAVYKILDAQLPADGGAVARPVRFASVSAVARPVAVILSVLANAGGAEQASAAFAAGASRLGLRDLRPILDAYDAAALAAALDLVRDASPAVRGRVVDAAAHCVAYDGTVRVEEMELMRALCAALSVQIPPMLSADVVAVDERR